MDGLKTQLCIVGGGPAGMMAGLLFARAGIAVTVLEKHADFLRDFRGDTIHPSTLDLMDELGLAERFRALPQRRVETFSGVVNDRSYRVADFSRLPTRNRFLSFMPQWDFLDFLAGEASGYPGFRLIRRTEAHDLIEDGGHVVGVRAEGPDGPVQIRSDLVLCADGRHSRMRALAGFAPRAFGAPIDVLWFRLPRRDGDPEAAAGRFGPGRILITLDRGDAWQCAYVVPKGGDAALRAKGLPAFRATVAEIAPFLADRTESIADWDAVKLLTVTVDRLARWHRPGLLCIGDAAHAMSPVGGVGINLAIQDAVAAANILAEPLRAGRVTEADLARVQARRMFPVRATQMLQRVIQARVIATALKADAPFRAPLALRILDRLPFLQALPARMIGMGVRPEHVAAPARA
ncbi:2-polyprenyl-6-methoxyphenol hydroxylase-like FAD-dependent oxidoreductase [Methylobacterium brachiatum]|uniref:2-polyprenyl-6-methoxyphenol hydroxylase-like FAD-dependent oxidoreductase n=1 Tax=Methylobacterium brachiatum TaxID=269660 RepID=A0AAJ1TTF7_9HYPH|nr:FAD-dependent oxidoreductase [Methylobacterium brachiatum]MCB4801184.1 FAD-dependent oxidoreductase [Methylobacterium brachiatum]MDQ0544614.1 2-polyprenyl-6-methoxyphenol hydroxylase-like FAD-dependent oxidoreductase [Methylobacterium brachiatum]